MSKLYVYRNKSQRSIGSSFSMVLLKDGANETLIGDATLWKWGAELKPGSPGVELVIEISDVEVEVVRQAAGPDGNAGIVYGVNGTTVQVVNRILNYLSKHYDRRLANLFEDPSIFLFGYSGLELEYLPEDVQQHILSAESPPEESQKIIVVAGKQWQPIINKLSKNPSIMRELPPREFEELICELLARDGLDVTLTPPTNDGGRDILAYMNTAYGRFLFLVECKRYAENNPVGVEIVRSLYGIVEQERATAGIVVATTRFTAGALDFQRKVNHRMSYRDYNVLIEWLKKHCRHS
ncbi:restriction endonuclease (plasmid) [Isosphaeraceae bacterium EP7]